MAESAARDSCHPFASHLLFEPDSGLEMGTDAQALGRGNGYDGSLDSFNNQSAYTVMGKPEPLCLPSFNANDSTSKHLTVQSPVVGSEVDRRYIAPSLIVLFAIKLTCQRKEHAEESGKREYIWSHGMR